MSINIQRPIALTASLSAPSVTLHRLLRTLSVVLLLLPPLMLTAGRQPQFYQAWQRQSDKELLSQSDEFIQKAYSPDKAIMCCKIVIDRYNEGSSGTTATDCVHALFNVFSCYYFSYQNLSKAYESLEQAERIATAHGLTKASIYQGYGHLYQTLAEQGHDRGQYLKALGYFRKSLSLQKDAPSPNHDIIFSNILDITFCLRRLDIADALWPAYDRHIRRHPSTLGRYNHYLYKGNKALLSHNYAEARHLFTEQLAIKQTGSLDIRYRFFSWVNLSRALQGQGQYREAVSVLDSALAISDRYKLFDASLVALQQKVDCFTKLGSRQDVVLAQNQYYQASEQLRERQQWARVKEMQFQKQLRSINEQLADQKQRRVAMQRWAVAILIIALVVSVVLLIIIRYNRRLHRANKTLYDQTQRLLEEQKSLQQKMRAESEPSKPEKYAESRMDAAKSVEMKARLEQAMAMEDAVYQPGFTITQLAEILGTNKNYLSQVINEQYNCNFPQFLNEYRVKRACMMIDDQTTSGKLTLEAICNEVGFRSRTSFIQAFKKFTGLKPSEYMRIAAQRA